MMQLTREILGISSPLLSGSSLTIASCGCLRGPPSSGYRFRSSANLLRLVHNRCQSLEPLEVNKRNIQVLYWHLYLLQVGVSLFEAEKMLKGAQDER
jgi:hypothetical protein